MNDGKKITSILELICNNVLSGAFGFIDKNTNEFYETPEQAPNPSSLALENPYLDWRYWNGVLNIAMLRVGKLMSAPEISSFAKKQIDFCFKHSDFFKKHYPTNEDRKWTFPLAQHFITDELDDCGSMGSSLIEIYQGYPEDKYRAYLDMARNHILHVQQRIEDQTLVRSAYREWTLWADDLYMSVAFLSRYGQYFNDQEALDDGAVQCLCFYDHLMDNEKNLIHHCWYSDVNKTNPAIWGRANGWVIMAVVDLLERLPKSHKDWGRIHGLFQQHIKALLNYQDSSGRWHQLIDREDSFLETSATAMISYALARSVNLGFMDKQYSDQAISGWQGLTQAIGPEGQISDVCTGTIISDDLDYYYNRPRPMNDTHGTGFILLAGAEVLNL